MTASSSETAPTRERTTDSIAPSAWRRTATRGGKGAGRLSRVATINTMFTLIAEWGITFLGTILFGATNLINEAGHWMHKQTFVRENRLFMSKARFNRLSIPSARYKNLINPKKWRL